MMNDKQKQAAAWLGAGILGAVALNRVNSRNAAVLGIPPLYLALLVAILGHLLA